MALDTFIAGPYTNAYAGTDTGVTENGYSVEQEASYQDIGPSDAYGDTVLDLIYRGGNVFLQFESKAYKAGSIAAMWPFAAIGALGSVGKMMKGGALVASNVLTRVLTASTPTTLTAANACLAKNFNVRLLFDSRLRTVPIRLQCLPADALTWFVTA